MGYMIATLSQQPDFAPSIKYFATFTLFGVGGLMMIVLLVNQWAVQDGNLYIAINGAQNLLSRIPKLAPRVHGDRAGPRRGRPDVHPA